MDEDGDGTLGAEEFQHGLAEINLNVHLDMVERLFKHFDASNDRRIQIAELVRSPPRPEPIAPWAVPLLSTLRSDFMSSSI